MPPVYVEYYEKEEYLNAMEKAVMHNDFSLIYNFYYYGICKSLFDIGIKPKNQLKNIDYNDFDSLSIK